MNVDVKILADRLDEFDARKRQAIEATEAKREVYPVIKQNKDNGQKMHNLI